MSEQYIRRLAFEASILVSVIGAACGLWAETATAHGIKLAFAIGEAATVLFGIFGVWLGICYRDDIETLTAGKKGDELKQAALEVVDRGARCEVLFKGLRVSAIVFAGTVFIRTFEPAIVNCCNRSLVCRGVFFALVLEGVVFLGYGILSPVLIMSRAMEKIRRAVDSAWETLRITRRS